MSKLVVVIEDDKYILDLIYMVIYNNYYEVEAILNISDLENTVIVRHPLLLNSILPFHNSKELCKFLKSNPLSKHIPIFLISAATELDLIAREFSADGFLCKPFDSGDLLAVIKLYFLTKGIPSANDNREND